MIREIIGRLIRFNVYNNSGEEIPPFGCMELDLAFDSGKSAFKFVDSDLVLQVKKPTSANLSKPELYIINGPFPIAVDGYGSGYKLPIQQVLIDNSTPPDVSASIGPQDASWLMSTSGSGWVVKSSDVGPAYSSGSTASVFAELVGGGGGQLEYFWPPSGGIGAATNTTSSLHTGVANCIRATKVSDGYYSPTSEYALVENAVGYTVGLSGKAMGCVKNKWGRWVVLLEDCSSNTISSNPANPNPDPVLPNSSKSVSEGFTLGV